jgi:hypothetical protein
VKSNLSSKSVSPKVLARGENAVAERAESISNMTTNPKIALIDKRTADPAQLTFGSGMAPKSLRK